MKNKNYGKIIYLGKGLALAYIITGILIVLFSLLLTFTSLAEDKLSIANTIIMIISIVSGSIYLAGKLKEKGWINGAILGLSYYLVLVILNTIFYRSISLDFIGLVKFLLAGAMGIIGGIIGINIIEWYWKSSVIHYFF